MNKYKNATLDSIAVMAIAMGVDTMLKDLKVGILMIMVGGIMSFLKYYTRKK